MVICRVSFFLTLGKAVICRVSFYDTRQTIFFSLLTSKLFLPSSYNTRYSMFQYVTFLGLFIYFFNLFHLIEFSWIIQIITASHSNNEKNEWKNDIHVISYNVRPYSGTDHQFRTSYSRNMTTNLRSSCF